MLPQGIAAAFEAPARKRAPTGTSGRGALDGVGSIAQELRGSKASRNASPSRFQPRTKTRMIMPG